MNEPIGLFGSFIPALERIIASLTSFKASSCPFTLFFMFSSRWIIFSLSPPTNLLIGILVQFEIILAISSSSTVSDNISFFAFLFNSSNSFSSLGIVPCLNLAASSKSYLFSACSNLKLAVDISSFLFFILSLILFSSSQSLLNFFSSSFNLDKSVLISSTLFLLISSFSFFRACFSISSLIIFLVKVSSSVGTESIWTLIVAQASSIKSIALSGRNLSVIYLFERVAAATNALSFIETPWWTSNLSFKPRSIVIVSITVGSLTITFWNLLSSAPSFSIYFLYSLSVVAPIHNISPLASIGFNILPASIAPSSAPAPTIICISSINKIISPLLSFISFNTAFNLSSNSPLYLAPAISAPRSSSHIVLFFKLLGTSPLTILCASPSTIAVLPTPGSPIKTGLFLVFLDNILVILLTSSSLPITGSILPSFTAFTISLPYFSSGFCKFSSYGFCPFIVIPSLYNCI